MGLLDDAIRDHLELKRRHGAGAGEVEALEHEALGPVRREDPPAAAPEPSEPVEPELPMADAEPETSKTPEAESEPAEPAEQPTQSFSLEDLAAAQAAHDRDEPAPDGGDEPAPGQAPADDVLDQTPEFLQETPEHDRLWFEQKPPRDFDF